ncbi:hypothetical protein L1887_23958 [Cichorium endivia]|nr:hypothetical protein L1887_23958 [Cichorium endivia]
MQPIPSSRIRSDNNKVVECLVKFQNDVGIQGQKVFEWDQTLDEVNMYITLPKGVPTKLIYYKLQSKHVEVGIKALITDEYQVHYSTHDIIFDE